MTSGMTGGTLSTIQTRIRAVMFLHDPIGLAQFYKCNSEITAGIMHTGYRHSIMLHTSTDTPHVFIRSPTIQVTYVNEGQLLAL